MRISPLLLVFVAAPAFADSGPPGLAPTESSTTTAAATSPLEQSARLPGAQRGFVFDTAVTVPVGDVEASARVIAAGAGVVDLAAGLTSTTELSAEAGLLGVSPTYATGLKQVIARGATWRVALLGSLRQIELSNVYPDSTYMSGAMPVGGVRPGDAVGQDRVTLLGIGAAATACVDLRCRVQVTGAVEALDQPATGQVAPLAWLDVSAGSPWLRAMAEAVVVGSTGSAGDGGKVFAFGLRGGWRTISLEGAIAVVPGDYTGASPTVAPYAGITVRP